METDTKQEIILKSLDECSVIDCKNKRSEGDRLFCGLHRLCWRNLVEPFGMVSEEDLKIVLSHYQMGLTIGQRGKK